MHTWVRQTLSANKNKIGPYTGSVRQLLCDDPTCVVCDKVAKEVMQLRMIEERSYSRGRVKPPFQSMEEQTPLTISIGTAKADCQVSGTRRLQKTSVRPPTPEAFKTTLGFQGNLQDHITQKSLGMRLEGFPMMVENSQWMTNEEQRNKQLPKLIPFGQSYPQLRNRLCLSLQAKVNTIEVNIRCKQLQFLWGLPSIHMQSLAKLVPSPPMQSAALPSQVQTCVECGHAEPSFIAPKEREILESHVLKKRLQHDWGLPSLVQKSLKQFLFPVPASSTHLNTIAGAQLEVQVVTSPCQISFAPLETTEHLEAHLRRKIVERWWGQPRRVLESLRVFCPPSTKSCKEDRRPFMLPLEGAVKKRVPPLMIQSFSKNLTVSSRENHPCLCWDWKQKALQGHLAKKVLEIQLGRVAQVAQQPSAMTHCVLPKVLPPGAKPPQPRCQQLLFMDRTVLDRIQLNLVHKELVYKWGLPTIYHRSIARLLQGAVLPATVSSFLSSKDRQFSFSAQDTPFMAQASRDFLEWHVKSKSLQHTWGLPGLIQRSLQYLLPDAGCVPSQKAKGRGEVAFCLTELSFISKATQALLEKNVRQRVIHQRWMLPKRVLESLRMLFPANQFCLSTVPQLWMEGTTSGQQGRTKKAKGTMGAAVRQLLLAPQARFRVRLQLHLAKKCLEVQLETFPPSVMLSHKCPMLMSRQPLPKVHLSGSRPLQHRTPFLPFGPAEEATRIEVCVQRCYLSSLWGLGRRYVEALSAMVPGPHSKPLQHNRAPFEFFHMDMPFLQLQDQKVLEQHLSKKRLQHEWGLPRTVQSSLTAFMQCFPPEHAFHRSENHIQVLQKEVSFLPEDTYNFLECHIRRMKLQQQWGLPRRVLNSLKLLFPEAGSGSFVEGSGTHSVSSFPWEPTLEGLHPQPWALGAKQERRKTGRMGGAAMHQTWLGLSLRTEVLGTLRRHIMKKALEVHLGCFPVIPTASWRYWSFTPRQPLPKPIHPGVRPLQPRIPSLSFGREEMRRVELTLRCRCLASLWGLGTKYVTAHTWMGAPRLPFSSLQPGRANFQFMGTKTPFLQGPSREALEQHVRKKKVQHEWGLPFLVQRSLQGFMEESPMLPHRSETLTQTCIMPQEVLFLSRSIIQHLEVHIQRMKLQCRWGLPQRILISAKHFLPLAPSGGALSSQTFKTKIAPGAEFEIGETHVHHESCLRHNICFHSKEDEDSRSLVQSREGPTQDVKKNIQQRTQVTTTHSGSEVVTLASPEMKPSFFTEEAWNLLEFHIAQKKVQHAWSLPSSVVRSLHHFSPFPKPPESEMGESIDKTSVWHWMEVKPTHQNLFFLSYQTKECLEAHVSSMATKRRWEIPKRVQHSLKGFMALRPPSQSELDPSQSLSLGQCESFQVATDDSQSEDEKEDSWEEVRSKKISRRKQDVQSTQRTTRPASLKASAFLWPQVNLLFLSAEARDLLELHIRHKQIQHAWGLPSNVLKSLHVFSPFLPETYAGPNMVKRQPQERVGVQIVTQSLPSFTPNIKEHLNAHLRQKIAEHRWGLPERVQQSLRTFLPPRAPSQPEVKPSQHLFYCQCKSFQVATDGFSPKENKKESLREGKNKKKAPEKPGRKPYHEGEVATAGTCPIAIDGTASSSEKARLPFLTDQAENLLEFHIQQKKIQHAWGVPSKVIQSLHVFSPFFINSQKHTGQSMPKMHLKEREVHIMMPRLSFLSSDTQEHLSAHLRHTIAEHRWGLPERVQQSLKAFLPPRAATLVVDEETTSAYSERMLPFLTNEVQNYLEFHIQRKKIQRAWGQPAAVLKSLHAFAPFPLNSQNHPPVRRGNISTHNVPQDRGEVHITEQPLSFLSPQTKECLEAHMRSMTAEHRWRLPQIVRETQRAFQPSSPPFWFGEAGLQDSTSHTISGNSEQTFWDRREAPEGKPLRASSEMTQPARSAVKLPFLVDTAQSLLEFHIQRKKIQHEWGLPATVQRSMHAFAPVSLEPLKSPWSATGVSDSPEGRWKGLMAERRTRATKAPVASEVKVTSEHLDFVAQSTQKELENHIQSLTLEHRWRLPKLLRASMKAFILQAEQMEEEAKPRKKALEKPGRKPYFEGEATRTSLIAIDGTASSSEKARLPFLKDQSANLLEFHIQQKKIQHAWGLPSKVIQSLHVFSPFFLESHKYTGQSMAKMHLQEREMQIMTPRLSFLCSDTQEHLSAHLRHMTAEHRWGLPERVQQSLKAFLPPRAATLVVDEERTSAYSERMLPFLTNEVQNYLECHIQHKKIQHAWGLPAAVLKSLHAFAPFLLDSQNYRTVWRGIISAHKVPEVGGEVHITEQPLSFLSPQTKECLEAHMRSMTAEHRWRLPKRVRETQRAFQPSSSPFWSGEAGLQDSTSHTVSGNAEQTFWDRREAPEGKTLRAISEMTHPERSAVKMPFLADAAHSLLEFHIQRKKIQHEWGLPATVQRSMHAFAPMSLEPPKRPWSPTGVSDSPEGRWKSLMTESNIKATKAPVAREVKVASEHLDFVAQSTQEELESHVQSLTLEHRWRLPKLLHESTKAFNPQAEEVEEQHKGEDEEEQTFIYLPHQASMVSHASLQMYTDKESNSSSEEVHSDVSEAFYDTGQARGKPYCLEIEKAGWCPGPKFQQVTGNLEVRGSWKSRRGVCGLRVSQNMVPSVKRTGHRSPESPPLSLSVSSKSRSKTKDIWEMEQSRLTPTSSCSCSCHLSASRKDSISSLSTDAKQLWQWQQSEEVKGKVRWNTSSSSLQSEHTSSQNSSSSPAESMKGSSLPEQEASWSYPSRSLEVQQYMASIYQEHMDVVLWPSLHVESHSSYEDIVSRKYRQAGREKCAKPHSRLHRRGSRHSWQTERAKELPHQTLGETTIASAVGSLAFSTARELGEWSRESIAGQSHYLKTPPVLKRIEDSITGKLVQQGIQGKDTSSEDSGSLEQRYQASSASADNQNCVDVECNDFQTHLTQADEDRERRGEDDGNFFLDEEQLHSSSALFLWDSDDKGFGGSGRLRKERKNDKDMEELDRSETESLRCRENAEARIKRGRGHGSRIPDKDEEVKLSMGAKDDEPTFLCGRPGQKEALGTKLTVSKMSAEEEDRPQFLSRVGPVDEMVSLIGGILERKLGLQDGYRVWKKCHEIPCLEVKADGTLLESKDECLCGDVREHKLCPQFLGSANPVDEKVSTMGEILERKLNLQDGYKISKKCHEIPCLEVKADGTFLESKDECLCGDVQEHKLCPQFPSGTKAVDETVSMIGGILERKLNLQDGYKIWKKCHDIPCPEVKADGTLLESKDEYLCADGQEHKLCPQFPSGTKAVDETVSMIGGILERKLNLQDGYKIWKKCHDIPCPQVKADGTLLESKDECLCGDVQEHKLCPQFLGSANPVDEKVSTMGEILERKLNLQDGYKISKKCHEIPCLEVKADGTLLESKDECLCGDVQEHKLCPQFPSGTKAVDETVSMIGGILERKLNLQDGYKIWKKCHEIPCLEVKAAGTFLESKDECLCGDGQEHKLCPQFPSGTKAVDETVSMIGGILERKLNLQDGYKIWKKCHDITFLEVKADGTLLESKDECLCGDVQQHNHCHQLPRGAHPIDEKNPKTGGILNKLKLHSIWKKSHKAPCLKVKASGTLLECKEKCLCEEFQDHKHGPQILGGARPVEKVSIIGGIMKKLNLPSIWKKNHEVPRPKAKASGTLRR